MASGKEKRPARFRPSKALYQFTYSTLAYLFGEKCSLCDQGPPDIKLEIDHTDGRRETWVLQKLSLKCVYHNRTKFLSVIEREREKKGVTGWVTLGRLETRSISWESSRSQELGPSFFLELQRILLEKEPGWLPTVKNVESRLAKILECTQAPVTRWIDRELQPEGRLFLSERTVNDGRKKRTEQIVNMRAERSG